MTSPAIKQKSILIAKINLLFDSKEDKLSFNLKNNKLKKV